MFDLAYLDKDGLASWEKSRQSPGWKYSPSEEHQPPTPDMIQSASIFHDSLTRFVLPLCSMMKDRPNSSVPITNFVYLVDASNLGLKQGWSVRFFAQEISWLLSTCYPETIQRIFVRSKVRRTDYSLHILTSPTTGMQCPFIFRYDLEIPQRMGRSLYSREDCNSLRRWSSAHSQGAHWWCKYPEHIWRWLSLQAWNATGSWQ